MANHHKQIREHLKYMGYKPKVKDGRIALDRCLDRSGISVGRNVVVTFSSLKDALRAMRECGE